ncbi:MAG: hypothetical protein ACLP3B_00320 [Syntrophobacteraceae bacterium]|jgi:hypothetical protein
MIPLEASGPNVVKNVHLVVSNTPRQTFYSIWIEICHGTFRVLKVSGAQGRVWDRRAWEFSTLDEAEALSGRRSPRKYSIKHLLPEKTNDGTK